MNRQEIAELARAEHEQFLHAIGELTLAWANAEACLNKVLRHYAGVSDAVGRALFSGTRARDCIKFLKAIAHNTKLESKRIADLEAIFSQIAAINTMRDWITHHVDGSEQRFTVDEPQRRFLSDAHRAMRIGTEWTVKIGSGDIDAMCKDLAVCCWRLQAHADARNVPFVATFFAEGGQPPAWLYTPPQPMSPGPRTRPADQTRSRPQEPSRGKATSKKKPAK